MLGSAEKRKPIDLSKYSNLCVHSTSQTEKQANIHTDRQAERRFAVAIPQSA